MSLSAFPTKFPSMLYINKHLSGRNYGVETPSIDREIAQQQPNVFGEATQTQLDQPAYDL